MHTMDRMYTEVNNTIPLEGIVRPTHNILV